MHFILDFCTVRDRYKATIYHCPKTIEEREDMMAQVQQRLADLEIVSFV